jgi:nucleoside-diphosphate-sugar epimerase
VVKKELKKKILIFGSSGFLGSQFVKFIKKKNFNIYTTNKIKLSKKNIENYTCNLLSSKNTNRIIKEIRPKIIINFAGKYKNQFETDIVESLTIHQNIFSSLIKNKLLNTKLLLFNSASEFGNVKRVAAIKEDEEKKPNTIYGLSKKIQLALAEYYFRNYKIKVINIRIFNIIPKDTISKKSIFSELVNLSKKFSEKKNKIIIKSSNMIRDYDQIDNICKGIFKILKKGKAGQTYNLGSGKPSLVGVIAKKFLNERGIPNKYIVLSNKRKNSFGGANSFYANIKKFNKL